MEEKATTLEVLGTTIPCQYIRDPETAFSFFSRIMKKDVLFGVDIETTPKKEFRHVPKAGLSPILSDIRLLQIFDGTEVGVIDCRFVPFRLFIPFLSSKRLVAHNAGFELKNFLQNGVMDCNISCTMLLAKLLFHATYPTDGGTAASLAALVETIFKIEVPKGMQVSDFGPDELTWEQIEYAALDAIYVRKIAERLAVGVEKLGMFRVWKTIKEALAPIARLELNGISLNIPYYKELIFKWREELYSDKKAVLELTGLSELTSAKLGGWLESHLSPDVLRVWPRTEGTGRLSTSADTFSDFSYLDIVEPFSRFQKKEKLTSSFGTSLLSWINPATLRLHASFKLLGARTGRLSASSPNLQQLPRDKMIRKAFVAREGYKLVRADYNQIELRVAAELSQDETMLSAYRNGVDLHALTASKVSGVPLSQIDPDGKERQAAKALNFGLLFGLGARKFSHYAKKSYGVEISDDDAHDAVQVFRDTYYGYREWQLDQASNAAEKMVCSTPLGKVRKLSQENAFGASMNTPVQGGAAEAMMCALFRINREIDNDAIRLVNCVHDEVVLEVLDDPDYLAAAEEILQETMTEGFLEVFPSGVTRGLIKTGVGDTWASAK